MLYFLLAVGLSIIFGLLRFVNFAHGAFYLLGAYFCYQAVAWGWTSGWRWRSCPCWWRCWRGWPNARCCGGSTTSRMNSIS